MAARSSGFTVEAIHLMAIKRKGANRREGKGRDKKGRLLQFQLHHSIAV